MLLLVRTTRAVVPTEAGSEYLARIDPVLDQLDEAQQSARQGELRGVLRVGMPTSAGSREIIPRILPFIEQHPKLELQFILGDQRQDLVRDGVDVAIRIGNLPDSSAVARVLTVYRRVIIASPAYLQRFGTPEAPSDIAKHRIVQGPAGSVWSTVLFLLALATLRRHPLLARCTAARLRGLGLLAVVTLPAAFAQVDSARAQSAGDSTGSSPSLESYYVGVRVGSMQERQDAGRIDQGLADRGFTNLNAATQTAGAAGTVFVGYEFTPHTAVELGYTLHEATAARVSGNIASTATLTSLLQDTTGLLRGYGNIVSLSYAGRFELAPRFVLEPRLGGFFWATKVSAISLDDRIDATHEGSGITAGLTAAYRVWRAMELGVSIDHYHGFPSNLATMYAGTIEWRFGR